MLQENGYEFTHNDPFLQSFSEVITWFQALRDLVDVEMEREFLHPSSPAVPDAPLWRSTLAKSARSIHTVPAHNGDPLVATSHGMVSVDYGIPTFTKTSQDLPSMVPERARLIRNPSDTTASPYLRVRCPQCFGGLIWGSSANECPDVIVAMDGNMQHRQYMFVGGDMVLPWNETCTFLTDAEIEEAALHVSDA
ncbi:uncharacterized protein EI90DRAFT_3133538 [Cantharellus anzutake]|nr:uncharacterized protein EI90DRAFT_3133538 [Cantharellus anzutake]KAF8318046.1 hypothetical protein EI90DRAFT_3133538 [Cantharellus anzutake]